MSVDVHTVWAELEGTRRDIATARHQLEFAHPDAVLAWRERLEQAEAAERDLLAQLERVDDATPDQVTKPKRSRKLTEKR